MSNDGTGAVTGEGDEAQGLVPERRFPEFRDAGDWIPTPLRKVTTPINTKVGSAKLTPVSITAGRGFVSQASKFGRDISGVQYRNYTHLGKGDFAYNKGNSLSYPQGWVCQLKEFEEAAASSAFMCFRLNDGYDPAYFQALFDQNVHGRQLTSFITSGARSNGLLNIRTEDFYGVKIPLPPQQAEQQKIADCLSSLDAVIAAEGERLAALHDHKKGLMQALFPAPGQTTPRLRFPEFQDAREWEWTKLDTLLKTITPPKKLLTAEYQPDGEFPIIDQGQELIAGWTNDAAALINKGLPLIVFGDHTCILKLIDFPFAQGADGIKILRPNGKMSVQFLFSALQADPLASDKYKRHFSDLKEKFVAHPDFETGEQRAVSECLTSLDQMILASEDKIVALKAHKSGLMQQLFPSPAEATP